MYAPICELRRNSTMLPLRSRTSWRLRALTVTCLPRDWTRAGIYHFANNRRRGHDLTGVRLEPVVFWPAGSASDLGSRVPGCCYGSLLAFRSAGESRCVTGPGVVAGRSAPLGSAGGQDPARHALPVTG